MPNDDEEFLTALVAGTNGMKLELWQAEVRSSGGGRFGRGKSKAGRGRHLMCGPADFAYFWQHVVQGFGLRPELWIAGTPEPPPLLWLLSPASSHYFHQRIDQ